MPLTVSTPYKSGTLASVSGATFNSNGTPFAAGDVGRCIVMTSGAAAGCIRRITGFVDSDTVTLDMAWGVSPFAAVRNVATGLPFAESAPAAGDAWVMSYDLDDIDNAVDVVKFSTTAYAIGALTIGSGVFIYASGQHVSLSSDLMRINQGSYVRFGDVLSAGAGTNGCIIVDTATATGGFAPSLGNTGDFHAYGCTIRMVASGTPFWRLYRGSSHVVRLVDNRMHGNFGCRVQGSQSILLRNHFAANNSSLGPFNTISPVTVVSNSVEDSAQAAYWQTAVSNALSVSGVSARNISRLLSIAGGTDSAAVVGSIDDSDLEKIASLPVLYANADSAKPNSTLRFQNSLTVTAADASLAQVTDALTLQLQNGSGAQVSAETRVDGSFSIPVILVRQFSVGAVGVHYWSEGTDYGPFLARLLAYGWRDAELTVTMAAPTTWAATLLPDSRVVAASAAAALAVSGITVTETTVTITTDVTGQQVFDFAKATRVANPGWPNILPGDSATDFGALDFDVAAGVTLTGSFTTTGTVTLGTGASVSGVYTDSTGTSAVLTLAGLQDASVLLVDGTGATVEFQAAQSGEFDYVYNFAPGATGTWKWVAKAPGREHATGTFTPGAGGAFTYAPVLVPKLTPSGEPMYTGTTSALVAVSISGTTNAYIDIGNGTAPLQETFNETELVLVTQAGMEWLAAGKDDVSLFDSGSGDYLFMTAGWRLRRASAGDANAAIEAYVTSAGGVIVDDTNGPVLYLTSNTPAAIAAAVWAYIDRELTQAIPTAAQNAAAVRTELSTELARLDVAVSTRATPVTVPTAAQNADALLGRNLAGGSDGGRTVRDALRASRNKSAISGGTLTIYQEDDATPAWTAAVSTAERDALQSIDPA